MLGRFRLEKAIPAVALTFAILQVPGLVLADGAAPAKASTQAPRKIEIAVTENGFEPSSSSVKKGETVQLVFTRKTDQTCATSVVVYPESGEKITRDLPLNQAVSVELHTSKTGELKYTCGMNMYSGSVKVE